MAAELLAGLGVLKTAFDLAKGLKDINDAAIRNGAIIELQEKILAAREQQSTLLDRISALEKEVAAYKARDAEKQRYELKNVAPGASAYMLKSDARGSEQPHWLCPNCYEQGKKSFFQKSPMSKPIYVCSACKANFTARDEPRWLDG